MHQLLQKRWFRVVLALLGAYLGFLIHVSVSACCLGGFGRLGGLLAVGLLPLFGGDCTIRLAEVYAYVAVGGFLGLFVTLGLLASRGRERRRRFIVILLIGVGLSALASVGFSTLDLDCQPYTGGLG